MKLYEKKISIIICIKNHFNYLDQALKSIQKQNYKNLEIIICLKNIKKIKLNLLNKFNFNFKIFIQKKEGLYNAINESLTKSSGEIIFILHPDNFIIKKDLLIKVNQIFFLQGIEILFSNLIIVKYNNVNKIIRRWVTTNFKKELLNQGWAPPHPTVFYSAKIATKFKYDEKYKISADYDLLIRILKTISEKKVFNLNTYSVAMRNNGISTNKKMILLKLYEDYLILKRNNYKYPLITILIKILKKIRQF